MSSISGPRTDGIRWKGLALSSIEQRFGGPPLAQAPVAVACGSKPAIFTRGGQEARIYTTVPQLASYSRRSSHCAWIYLVP